MKGVRIHPESGKRRVVDLPDDPVEFDEYLKKNRYERVVECSERETIRAAVSARNCTYPDYYVYLPERSFGRNIVCFGPVLLWYTEPTAQSDGKGGGWDFSADMTIRASIDYGVFPAEWPDMVFYDNRPGYLTQQFRCYRCQLPVTQYINGVPWCDNGHAAVPPGISVEEHVKRDFLNQYYHDYVFYPGHIAEKWSKPYTPEDVNCNFTDGVPRYSKREDKDGQA